MVAPRKNKGLKKKVPNRSKKVTKTKSKSSTNKKIALPVIVAPDLLPLLDPNFTWEKFEKFSKDLIKLLHKDNQVHLVGVKGQKQYGIDIVAQDKDGGHFYAQNKRYKNFSVAQFRKAKKELKLKKKKTILLLACDASADLRLEVLGDKDWEIWDVTDISDKAFGLEDPERRDLIKKYFGPEWAKAFSDYNEFSSIVPSVDFFRNYFDPQKLFNHSIPFIGRDKDILSLKKFAHSNHQALILNAAGGIGKSRLLWEFSKECKDIGWSVLFVREGIAPQPDHFQSINSKQVIFIFDDAHRFNLAPYLAFIYALKIKYKIIFSTRPQGRQRLKLDLTKNNLESSEIQDYEVKKFDISTAKTLVTKLLPQVDSQHVLPLAKLVEDSTLVGILACNLIKRKSVFLSGLSSEEDIKDKIVSSFTDELSGRIDSNLNINLIQKVLNYTSALSPVEYRGQKVDPRFVSALEEKESDVAECIADLLHSGILVERGDRLRITPDVLSDCILERCCYLKNNAPSSFFKELFGRIDEKLRNRLLKNISELDWRKKGAELTSSVLLKDFWNQFKDDSVTDLSVMDSRLTIVKSVSFFQPVESYDVLQLSVKALSNISKDDRDYRFSSCISSIVDICRYIILAGYKVEDLMMTLWQLGKNDERNLNPHPEHPIRRLADLCSYERNFPIALYERTFQGLVAIINSYDSKKDFHDPISMLGGFLAKTSSSTYSEGNSFTISPFHISYENTKKLRLDVFSILKKIALANDLKSAYSAVSVIAEASSVPNGMMGLQVSKKHIEVWSKEIDNAVDLLVEVYSKTPFSLIKVHVKNKLNLKIKWNSRSKYKAVISKFLTANPFTVEELKYVPFAFWSYNDLLIKRDYKDYKKTEVESQKIYERITRDIIAKLKEPRKILKYTEEVVSELLTVKDTVSSRHFSTVLSDSIVNEEMCDALLENNSNKIEHDFSVFLRKVSERDTATALQYVEKALNLKNIAILRSVAESFWWIFENKTSELEVNESFLKLFEHEIGEVRLSSLSGIRTLAYQGHKEKAIELMMRFEFNFKRAAESFFDLVNPYCIRFDDLSDDQFSKIISKLRDVEDLTDHGIGEFVSACATRIPASLVDMLLDRVENKSSREQEERFVALPYLGFSKLELNLNDEEMNKTLSRISSALQKEDADTFWLPRLYYNFGKKKYDLAIVHLTTLIKSNDIEVVGIGVDLLKEFNHTLVFTKQELMRDLLNHGKEKGSPFFERIKGGLFRAGIPMSKQGTAGQPMPQDVALVENATTAMAKATSDHERQFYRELKEYGEREIADDIKRNQRMLDSD